jgi:hypothetical protein
MDRYAVMSDIHGNIWALEAVLEDIERRGLKHIVNPGSVGLQAYTDDAPEPHAMECGSPHARYAVLSRAGDQWSIEAVSLPYAWNKAAGAARRNGRNDWVA